MSGPATMALGRHTFTALGFGYGRVDREIATPWDAQAVAGRIEALQFSGPASETVTVRGVLFPQEFGGLDTLDALRSAALAGERLMLVTLEGRILGFHVIEQISEDRSHHTATALPRRLAYTLRLRRYAAPDRPPPA